MSARGNHSLGLPYLLVNRALGKPAKILIFSSILVFLKIVRIIVMLLASKLLIILLLSIN